MLKKISWTSIGIILSMASYAPKILAHNTGINYRQTEAIEIMATFDNGTPMKQAQVVIYAPNNLSQPWLKGMTDEEGKFIFSPDTSIIGNWAVKVRSAGHGSLIDIPIESPSQQNSTSSTTDNLPQINNKTTETETKMNNSSLFTSTNNQMPTTLQKLMMAVVGVWGFVGTALFFSRNNIQKG